jgi:CRISPR/Cas system-associated exonuclease Cas4 (RecB family)
MLLPEIETTNVYAEEGTKKHTEAHALLCEYLKGKRTKREILDVCEGSVHTYLNTIFSILDTCSKTSKLHLEERINYTIEGKLSSLTLSGKPDAVIVDKKNKVAHVVDLKTGYVPVPPYSLQLLGYAYLVHKNNPTYKTIYTHIAQENNYNGLTFKIELSNGIDNSPLKAIDQILENILANMWTAPLHETGPHCFYCPAKRFCWKFKKTLLDMELAAVKNKDGLTDDEKINIQIMAKPVTSLLDNVKKELMSNKPELFSVSQRTYYKWKDDTIAPKSEQIIACKDAIKSGLVTEMDENVESKTTKVYSFKKIKKI